MSELWVQAIAELKQVPGDSPQWAEAQAKSQEYAANLSYAQTARAQASVRELERVSQLSATRLKTILADGPMQVMVLNHHRPWRTDCLWHRRGWRHPGRTHWCR